MADLVTRLLLDNSDFEKNLSGASKSLGSFKKRGASTAGSLSKLTAGMKLIGGSVGKLLGPLGVAMTAFDVFERTVNSNRTTQKKFSSIVGGTTMAIDNFFDALVTGNWSPFEQGIGKAIKDAVDLKGRLDDLGLNMQLGKTDAELREAERNKLMSKLESEDYTKKEKAVFLDEYLKLSQEEIDIRNSTAEDPLSALKDELKLNGVDVTGLTEKTARNYLLTLGRTTSKEYKELAAYEKKRNEEGKKLDKELLENISGKYDEIVAERGEEGYKELFEANRKKKNALTDPKKENEIKIRESLTKDFIEKYKDWLDESNEHIDKTGTITAEMESARKAAKSGKEDIEKTNYTPAPKPEPEPTVTTQGIKSGYFSTPMIIPPTTLADLEAEKEGIIKQMNNATSAEDYVKLKVRLDAKDAQIEDWKNGSEGMQIKGLDVSKAVPLEFEPTTTKASRVTKNLEGFGKAASEIATLSGALEDLTTSMMGVGEASKGMAAALTVANFAASMALMIQTMVEKSRSSLTIWDWIAGIAAGTAACVSAAAQLSSIMKYADGGIVGGNKTIGDMNLARVNAGEMILNNRQQRNLFNLLNNGGGSATNNSQVEFKIEGKQLVGVLNNYNNKRNKVI